MPGIDRDLEVIEHLDFDIAQPCEATVAKIRARAGPEDTHAEIISTTIVSTCSNPAEWLVVRSNCCGKGPVDRFMCDKCLQRKLNRPRLICTDCGYIFIPPSSGYSSMTRL